MVRLFVARAGGARAATGPGCAVAEEEILKRMEAVMRLCSERLADAGVNLRSPDALVPALRPYAQVSAELQAYALECFQFAARPRDAFAGARRGLALNIVGAGAAALDSSPALELVRQALRRGRPQEVRGAINFLEDYFTKREDELVPDDIVDGLLAVAEKTKSESTAVGALNVLVVARQISEWEASDRISDWKDRHYR
jgi:hypothetical protein